ncbi:hypothetical protein BDK51DRAFT_36188 [Blyttiomyces helicus]|uniref:FAD/NAD(P)-binding domain-containing protein n=1 Tax=Blyttiomyces helicus TaxID=388810 RepID=A0A4P9VYU2_9FUNG|nr:hypothetical protein BDK51DRAFT_36188 [Blyttiomyces helicus]|eukprot:RKO84924.1 hypothetical protein BDK51DRAFT_36188 [Blyttiomyces helicus]
MIRKVVIIDSGPAAHAAALYCARANLRPLLCEGSMAGEVAAGGQQTTTTEVEDFLGFPKDISGLVGLGTEVVTQTVSEVDRSARLEGREGEPPVLARSVIVATGTTARRMDLPGEERYWQAGVFTSAVRDGAAPMFREKPAAIVGGGDFAAEQAILLTQYASKVYVLNTVPVTAEGNGRLLHTLIVKDTISRVYSSLRSTASSMPSEGTLALDSDGYIRVQPESSLTNVQGVFAASAAIAAARSGSEAALDCEDWLEHPEEWVTGKKRRGLLTYFLMFGSIYYLFF